MMFTIFIKFILQHLLTFYLFFKTIVVFLVNQITSKPVGHER